MKPPEVGSPQTARAAAAMAVWRRRLLCSVTKSAEDAGSVTRSIRLIDFQQPALLEEAEQTVGHGRHGLGGYRSHVAFAERGVGTEPSHEDAERSSAEGAAPLVGLGAVR